MKLTRAEQLCWDVMVYAAFSEQTSKLTGKEVTIILGVLFGDDIVETLQAVMEDEVIYD